MLRGALLGAGRMGQVHLRKLSARDDVEVVAVVDPAAPDLGFPSRDTVPEGVDFAVVATPSDSHFAIATELVERGIACLVEKPLAATAREAAVLARSERLSVHQVERYNPALDVLPRPLDLSYFKASRLAAWDPRGAEVDVLLDLMVHDLDLFLSWVDSPVVEVRACGLSVKSGGLDVVEAWLETESGCVATLCASRLSHKKERVIRLVGPDDYWSIDLANGDARAIKWRSGDLSPQATTGGTGDAVERFHDAFLAAVRGEGPFPCPGSDSHRVLEVLDRIRAAAGRN